MILLILMVISLSGCVSMQYTTANGEKFEYTRWGAQSTQGLTMAKDDEGILTVTLEKNKADAGDIGKAMADLAATAAKISGK